MQEKSTDELDAQLRNTTPDCMDKYYKENERRTVHQTPSVCQQVPEWS